MRARLRNPELLFVNNPHQRPRLRVGRHVVRPRRRNMKRRKSRRSSSWKRISRLKGLTMKQKSRMYRGKSSRRSGPKRRRRSKSRNHPLRVKYRGRRPTLKQLSRMIGKRKARKLFSKRKGKILYHGKTRLRKANRSHRRVRRSKRRNFR
jgi:hypothetical protein